MRKLLLYFFILLSTLINAQNVLTGIVLNDKNRKPIEYASIYLSGTTLGTYTDSKGHFTIKDVSAPGQLVVSHLAYNLKVIPIEKPDSVNLTIYLKEKTNQLSGVSISGKSRRNNNIKEFKEMFLGNDRWGRYAMLKNDSVLIFSRYVDTLVRKANPKDFEKLRKYKSTNGDSKCSADSSSIISYIQMFSAKTKSPLLIELPSLGYSVYLDLVSFNLESHNEWADCDYWAYHRFVPQNNTTTRQQERFEKNRQDVYYNSSRHFCKSLFTNNLKENGYLISFRSFNDSTKKIQHNYIDINQYIKHTKTNEIQVIGLYNKKIDIYYFCKYNGKPTNLTLKRKNAGSSENEFEDWDKNNNSYVIFKSDTCTIRSNGTIPNNNILFGGSFSTKRGGTLLPFDYFPEKENQ